MLRLSPRRLPVALFVAPLVGLLPSTAAAQAPDVVARGLDNPRGVAIGPDGAVWVAEAGRGGSRPCIQGPEGERVCAGTTGAITRIADGRQRRVVRGLPSLATRAGDDATGPHDVAIRGRGQMYAVVGLGANPSRRARLGRIGRRFAHLFRITESGRARAIADIGRFETEANPDQDLPGAEVDTNPYSVLAQASRRLVVDAGGNTLLGVARGGRTSTLAVFPTRIVAAPGGMGPPAGTPLPMQSVPTSVTENRDGAIYVSELTGFPFPRGGARIYKVLPGSTTPQVIAEGFTNVIDLAFGPDGSLYVLEITANGLLSGDPAGALTRLRADGTRRPVPIEGLQFPGGLAVAANGDLFVSNRGVSAGSGQVLRVRPGA